MVIGTAKHQGREMVATLKLEANLTRKIGNRRDVIETLTLGYPARMSVAGYRKRCTKCRHELSP